MAIGSRRQRRDIADSGNCDNKNALATRRKNWIEISPLHSASVEMENNEITTDAPKLFEKIKREISMEILNCKFTKFWPHPKKYFFPTFQIHKMVEKYPIFGDKKGR